MQSEKRHGSPMQPKLIDTCRIRTSKGLGRYIVVSLKDSTPAHTLPGGTKIFSTPEYPYASILHDEYRGIRCEECLREPDNCDSLIACLGCSSAHFCSVKCLQTGFQTWHGFECGRMPIQKSEEVSERAATRQQRQQQQHQQHQFSLLARLALRIFWKEYRLGRLAVVSETTLPTLHSKQQNETQQQPEQPVVEEDGRGLSLDHLCSNLSKMEKSVVSHDQQEAEALVQRLDLTTSSAFATRIAAIMAILRSNAIGIRAQKSSHDLPSQGSVKDGDKGNKHSTIVVTQESALIGTGLYLLASMVNHSCSPNALLVFGDDVTTTAKSEERMETFGKADPRALNVIVTQDIPHTDQKLDDSGAVSSMVTISYGPQKGRMDTAERRKILREKYCFDCQCSACSTGNDIDQGFKCLNTSKNCENVLNSLDDECPKCHFRVDFKRRKELEYRIQQLQARVEQSSSRENSGYSPYNLLALLQQLENTQALLYSTTSNKEYGNTCDQLARVYAELGDFASSAEWSRKSLAVVRFCYGDDAIETAQEMFKLSGLLFNSRKAKEALVLIKQTILLYKKHFGEHSNNEELQELLEMETCLLQFGL